MSEKTINGNTFLGDVILQKTSVDDTTNSGSTTTGALTVAGGVGIKGNLNVGGNITGGSISYSSTSTGTLAVTNTTNATSTTTGVLTVAGGMGVAKDIYAANLRLTQYLNVSGTGVPVTTLQANGNGVIGNQAGHYIGNNLYFSGGWQRISTGDPGFCFRLGNSSDTNGNGLQFYVGDAGNLASSKMVIQPNGNVGVGTTTPGVPLHVQGTLRCDEFIGGTGYTYTKFSTLAKSASFNLSALGYLNISKVYIRKRSFTFGASVTKVLSWDDSPIQVAALNTGAIMTFRMPDPTTIYLDSPNAYGVSFKFINSTNCKTVITDYANTKTFATLNFPNDSVEIFWLDGNGSLSDTWGVIRTGASLTGTYSPNLLTVNATQTTTFSNRVGTYCQTGDVIVVTFQISGSYVGVGAQADLLISLPAFGSFVPDPSTKLLSTCVYNGFSFDQASVETDTSTGVANLKILTYYITTGGGPGTQYISKTSLITPPAGNTNTFDFKGTITYKLIT